MEFLKKKSATALLEPKTYAKNAYFAIFAAKMRKGFEMGFNQWETLVFHI